jgi:hypothetical protein
MHADKAHSVNAFRFSHSGIEATTTDSYRFWLSVFWGMRSAFIGVHRRFVDSLCEESGKMAGRRVSVDICQLTA